MREFIKEHCTLEVQKEIEPLIEMYSKYNDLMTSSCISPQKQAKKQYEEPQITFTVNDPTDNKEDEVIFTATKRGVDVCFIFNLSGEPFREDYFMTHENCFKYLAQLPRGWHMFTTEEDS